MIPARSEPFNGIYTATVCPFARDGTIDEEALARHMVTAVATPGIVGVLINGHAGENFLLTRAEKRRVVEIAHATIGPRAILVCGINAESSLEAAEQAHDAEAAGADALLVFPPFSWALSQDDTMALNHHRIVAAASGMPLVLYQAGVSSAMAYSPEVLTGLVRLPNVVAIKEGSWESARYESNRRLIKRVAPHVAVMASGDEHLLTCMVVGSEGSMVSLAVLVPDLIVALDRAVAASDLATARKLNGRIQPLAKAIYGTRPTGHANARLKVCLRLLGQLEHDGLRPPIGPLGADEVAMLRAALVEARLLDAKAARAA